MSVEMIVASDSHGRGELLRQLERAYPKADVFVHCGDLEEMPEQYPRWVFVRGNNDYYADPNQMPDERILNLGGHRFYVTHSHLFPYYGRERGLAARARKNNCDVVLYGHTHRSDIHNEEGILEINPGSLLFPRDGNPPSYAHILIDDDGTIHPEIIFQDEWPFEEPEKSSKFSKWFW